MQKNPHAVALGRRGGRIGGLARAAKLTPERRTEIARKAAQDRWARVASATRKTTPTMSKKELEREIARLRGELEIIRDTVTDHGEDSVPVAWLVDRCDAALAGVNDEEEEGV